uniref:Uncharacterized protein n=1 Tax=Ciona intestinalis TaxID=7719 RepID=H2XTJ0_CIOIN
MCCARFGTIRRQRVYGISVSYQVVENFNKTRENHPRQNPPNPPRQTSPNDVCYVSATLELL